MQLSFKMKKLSGLKYYSAFSVCGRRDSNPHNFPNPIKHA